MQNATVFAEEIRLAALETFEALGFGHVGGAMSVVETLAVLYGGQLRHDPKNPAWPERDRFVMSKGHAGPALYATLALRGYFPMDVLKTLNKPGTSLPSHCDRLLTTGVDMTTGSLGQGASSAVGIAMGQKLKGWDARTFLVLGDGELNEGQVWEALMLAAFKKLDNLVIFCDKNGRQLDGATKDVLDMGDIAAKFAAFGLYTQTIDGHDVGAIAKAIENTKGQPVPSMIVLNTVKGHTTFVADMESNHHVAFKPEQIAEAIENTKARLAKAKEASK